MFKGIVKELLQHSPFTVFGALSGIVLMFLFRNFSYDFSNKLFYVFHPLHVLLSAIVTASVYRLHTCPRGKEKQCNLPILFIVGYIGSIGIATLSDSIIPYMGEVLLHMPHRHYHIGFLENWWLISGIAIVGIVIAYFNPTTKFPHSGHVLISTWASLFHIMMAKGEQTTLLIYLSIFLFLFLAVWVPCCLSDIIFPLLFVRNEKGIGSDLEK